MPRPSPGDPIRHEICVTLDDGRRVYGSFSIHNGFVRLSSTYGARRKQIGAAPPGELARIMLRELVREDERSARPSSVNEKTIAREAS